MSAIKTIKRIARAKAFGILLRAMVFAAAGASGLALAEVSQVPLFIVDKVKPNIMFTLDDSGSMDSDYMPDSANTADFNDTAGTLAVAKFKSPAVNRVFYNPAVRYRPWQKADGTWYPNSTPNAAPRDPRDTRWPRRLLGIGTECGSWDGDECDQWVSAKFRAFYYKYKGGGTESYGNYEKIEITSSTATYDKGEDRTDCVGATCTYAEEIQNFANWYTYYRKRLFTAIAGASQSFNALDANFRVGYGEINSSSRTIDNVSTRTIKLGVRDFTGTDRSAWFTKLFAANASGWTPLRRAADDVGKYFKRADEKGPWAQYPGVSKGTEYTCRKSYHILMTDGYWTNQDSDDANTAGAKNADNGMDAPYGSDATDTLADVAMYYWKNDLRTDLANRVPVSDSDPADWQHLVQYTVGLGVSGTLNYPADEAGMKSGAISWPVPAASDNNDKKKIDDLWHAAVNGHGMYFSAQNPAEFVEALFEALADIQKQSAASAVAVSSSRVEDGGNVYVPGFESGSWLGHLKAYPLNTDGTLGTQLWDAAAADKLGAWNQRNIVTWNGSKGVNFSWPTAVTEDTITQEQVNALGSVDVLEYIKGNGTKEKQAGGTYRNRVTKLGDIVNSPPLIAGKTNRGYAAIPEPEGQDAVSMGGNTYNAFVATKGTRTTMVYVGANDGMLHGFDGSTGVEKFAFIPGAVYPNLRSLSTTSYTHKYFVDGHVTEGDAYLSGSWKNILMGSAGAGAKSVFAINITNPGSMAAGNVMWEKTASSEDANNQDMGYVMGQLELERMADDSWAVIHGNGYESESGKAVLYIRDAATGAVHKKIVINVDGTNGLSAPVFVRDNQRRVIAAYAGDLQGNLWKFDLNSSNTDDWKVAYSSAPSSYVPLFKANKEVGKLQPITQRPTISEHPKGGYIITFGTGKYYDKNTDNANTDTQSIYGIWDNGSAVTGVRSTILQQQTLTPYSNTDANGVTVNGATLTNTGIDWTVKRGWFIDLTLSEGEQVIADSRVIGDIFWQKTFIPNTADPCVKGGTSRLYGINYVTGGAVLYIFDTNNDGQINSNDAPISGINTGGSISDPSIVRTGDDGGIFIDNPLEGEIQRLKVKFKGQPFRTWRILSESY